MEQKLDNFDLRQRRDALLALCRLAEEGKIALPKPGNEVNLHAHTFFSYNAYGYSPSNYAWRARKAGLAVAGVVDFDVLDALEEFLEAGRLVGLKTFGTVAARNEFFEKLGRELEPGKERRLSSLSAETTPGQITKRVSAIEISK